MNIAIVGLGSPFGDDRAGWIAAEAIGDSPWLRALPDGSVRVERLDRPGAGLLAHLDGVTHAVVIDAMRSGAPPGTVRLMTPEEIGSGPDANASTHGFGLAHAMALGHALGQLPPRLVVFGIEAGDTPGLHELSPPVRAAMPALVSGVGAWVLASLGLNAAVCG